MGRRNIAGGSPWEDLVGYSRAVKVGGLLEVAGTTAVNEHGEVMYPGDAFGQTRYILEKIGRVLKQADMAWEDVIRTRMYVTDISRWEEIGRAHALFFKDVKPAATMVEVSALISPELLVEIEVSAVKEI